MAGLITVRLQRNDAQPWGFRLQGGKDFGTPLLIQKVNGGSLAEKAGLQVADAVIKVNGQDVYNLRHKDAQDSIVKAGNSMEIVVSRSPGGTWKPNVTPVGNIPAPSPVGGAPAAVTKTSLAYKGPPAPTIPGYNTAAKPFSPQLNGVGGDQGIKSITSKQYNNPVGLYSDQTIAETLSAQAEVLAGGVLGVNFMKNEKTKFDASHSEVLKLVQEIDSEPKTPEPVEPASPAGGVVVPPPVSFFGVKHVAAPETKPPSTTNPQASLAPGQNVCADCERLIVGVFVRIKDKNLHVDCFKCATCGTSLKNVGYYNINNKLYCDIHAKLVARANPPAPNLDPITIPPGGPIPSGVISAPLAPTGPASPQPGTLAPLPFHAPRLKPSHVNPPRSFKPPSSNVAPPKPFAAPPAPASFNAPAAPPPFSAPPPSVTSPAVKPFSSVQFNPPSAPAPAPISAPAPAPFASAPAPPSSFPKTSPGQIPSKPLGKKGPGGAKGGSTAGTTAPRRGRGVLNAAVGAGARIPLCGSCNNQIRGPFITALGKIWCPDHFVCVNAQCRRPLQDIGFVEEEQGLYCEYCFEQYLAPSCNKCNAKIKGDCLNAIGKHFHPECFTCAYCGKLFGNSPFFLEDALPYCETDWNELFTTKCFSCGFPIEAGDRWVEALNNNYHSQCFSCTMCKKNLEGQSFFAKGGRPFCKNHAR